MRFRIFDCPDPLLAHRLSRRRVLAAVGGAVAAGVTTEPTGAGAAPSRLATVDPSDRAPSLRDFGATTALVGLSPAFRDYKVSGDYTVLTAGAAERAQLLDLEVINVFYGDLGLRQERHDTFVDEPETSRLYLSQYQFPDRDGAAAGFGELGSVLDYPGAEDVTREVQGQTQSFGRRFQFQTEAGEEIDRVNTAFQWEEIVVTGTYDIIGQESDSTDRAFEAFATLLAGYGDDAWGGEVGEAAQAVTSRMPLVEGLEEHRYYYGLAGGEVVPRFSGDAAATAAENPGVETALFGSYSLGGGPFPITVFFGARSFADLLRSDEYWEQLESLMANNRSGVRWRSAGSYAESEYPSLLHAGAWSPREDILLTGAHAAAQYGGTVVDIGVFTPYSGDPAAFAEFDPTGEREYDPLRGGLASMFGSIHPRSEWEWQAGYLPAGIPRPAEWE